MNAISNKLRQFEMERGLPATVIGIKEAKLAFAHVSFSLVALLIGGLCGLLQTMVRTGAIPEIAGIGYYELLTAHGLMLAIVFTTLFIFGLLFSFLGQSFGRFEEFPRRLGWVGFWFMILGVVLVTWMVLAGEASVLYTFYAPLKAHPVFYIGLVIFVVGTWIASGAMFRMYADYKREHPGVHPPLQAYMSIMTALLWVVATLGVAATILFQLLPLSLGWTDKVGIELSRTLFWYFGHPLVYFWLLPAYIVWYTVIPKIVGGKIFSDALARMSFLLFLLFSFPVGFHHQLLEPGISAFWKYVQVVLTFLVIIPSLMTAFSMFATFELAGRRKGATGIFGWVKKMPYRDVRFLAPFIGMLFFIPAGAGGVINASHQLNIIVHNTLWVTGHFHITVGAAVALTFFGTAYWLVPLLRGRTLTAAMNRLGLIQTAAWTIGMLFMSTAMHISGLLGNPRRTGPATYFKDSIVADWIPYHVAMAIGGTILFISILLFLYAMFQLAFRAPKGTEEFPIAETEEEAMATPFFFENWKLWIFVTFALIAFAYTVPIWHMIENAPPGAPGWRLW